MPRTSQSASERAEDKQILEFPIFSKEGKNGVRSVVHMHRGLLLSVAGI